MTRTLAPIVTWSRSDLVRAAGAGYPVDHDIVGPTLMLVMAVIFVSLARTPPLSRERPSVRHDPVVTHEPTRIHHADKSGT